MTWAASPARELLRLAWPIAVSLLSFSTMTAVDTAFVGRLGAPALAAVGVGGSAILCVSSFGVAVFAAAKVQVGRCFGAGEPERAHVMLGAFLRLALLLGVLSGLVSFLVSRGLPQVHADPVAGRLCAEYTAIRSVEVPLALFSSALGQWRQAAGDSRTAMRAALLANVVNIPLNAVLIFVCGWGVVGAALATVLARSAEAAWLLWRQRREGLFWRRSSLRRALGVLRLGSTTGVERVLDMAVFLVLAALLARVSSVELAAHQIALQVAYFCFLPLIASGEAISVLTSQTRGAGAPAVQRRLLRVGFVSTQVFSSVAGLALVALSEVALRLFTTDAAVLASAARVVVWAALLQWLCAPFNVLKGLLRGVEDFHVVAWVAVGCAWLVSPPLTWLLAHQQGWGAAGAWIAMCVEVACGATLLLLRARRLGLLWGSAPQSAAQPAAQSAAQEARGAPREEGLDALP